MKSGARRIKFESYSTHAWLKRVYAKLTADERAFALRFIDEHDALDRGAFESAVNRLFFNANHKSKNWLRVSELLSCCNAGQSPTNSNE
jgi:hypothetical protein